MQFYLNGYKTGDPCVEDPHPSVVERPGGLPEDVDVLIVGCGPAGLVLAAQLASFPEIRTAVIDRRDGPLQVGQADGVACRTVEMFEAFGLADRLVSEAYWVNEVSFWRPSQEDPARIARTARITDVEPDTTGSSEYPVTVTVQRATGDTARVQARYVAGCDGARSRTRTAIGRELAGDAT